MRVCVLLDRVLIPPFSFCPLPVPRTVLDLARKMLLFDPRGRITMEDALRHPLTC